MTACVHEYPALPSDLLLTILIHLVPPNREKNKSAYELAHNIVGKVWRRKRRGGRVEQFWTESSPLDRVSPTPTYTTHSTG